MNLSNLLLEEKRSHRDFLEREYSNDKIFERILLLIVSVYKLSQEMRTQELDDKVMYNKNLTIYSMPLSEIYLGKSLELAFIFLPHDTPLVV